MHIYSQGYFSVSAFCSLSKPQSYTQGDRLQTDLSGGKKEKRETTLEAISYSFITNTLVL